MLKGKHIFISHTTADDAFVKRLRHVLELNHLSTWVDSEQMRGSDTLWGKVSDAIADAGSVIVVLSPDSLNSGWVARESDEAMAVKERLGLDEYRIIPIALPGVRSEGVKRYFRKDTSENFLARIGRGIRSFVSIFIGQRRKVSRGAGTDLLAVMVDPSAPDALDTALPQIFAALGLAAPTAFEGPSSAAEKPISELILDVSDTKLATIDNKLALEVRAKLVYLPAGSISNQPSSATFTFTSPVGKVEADDLKWYLESYLQWPDDIFRKRAKGIEEAMVAWGKALYDALFNDVPRSKLLQNWLNSANSDAELRFSVLLSEVGAHEGKSDSALAASQLLALPWELLHDDRRYLFQGGAPIRVRRSLANDREVTLRAPNSPLRILLVSPRPERPDGALWLDPRASALPLVEAVEALGSLAELTVLPDGNFPDMLAALQAAKVAGRPYDVVHFDGHGVWDPVKGLGMLCFEDPADRGKVDKRAEKLVSAQELGEEMAHLQVPLFFLEACQTAKSEENPEASVAARLLREGVGSVVSMSHSVLVVTASKFVKAFYEALADGKRVGAAMLAGQHALYHDRVRLTMPPHGKIELQDWFVPVLFQYHQDPILIRRVPTARGEEDNRKQLRLRLGNLPEAPKHHFHGRDRELLWLERLLQKEQYAVVCGIGGMGKTTIAAELATWLVRTGRFARAAFVSVERYGGLHGFLFALGTQLLPMDSKALTSDDELRLQLHRLLREQRTLIVIDNMESILPRKGEEASTDLMDLLNACKDLLDAAKQARLVFTSREDLPAPFEGNAQTLGALRTRQAIKLVRDLLEAQNTPLPDAKTGDAHAAIRALVEQVGGHPRALVLLAPFIAEGIEATTAKVQQWMQELATRHPGERENSLFASVALSLERLSPKMREQVQVLAVFFGGFNAWALSVVLGVEVDEAWVIANALAETGLVHFQNYAYFSMDPALPAYLDSLWQGETGDAARTQARQAWLEAMVGLMGFVYEQQFENAELSATLGQMEIPNLVAAMEVLYQAGDTEQGINFATKLEQVLRYLGRRDLEDRVGVMRRVLVGSLGDWGNAAFESARQEIEALQAKGLLQEAYEKAVSLRETAVAAGPEAYLGAAYDIAMANSLLGTILQLGGQNEAALQVIKEAQKGFEELAATGSTSAARMVSACVTEAADCMLLMGKLDEAIQLYEERIRQGKDLGDLRGIAVAEGNLGTVYMDQGKYDQAIRAHLAAKETFSRLGEPPMEAISLHQLGMAYERKQDFEAAERAYKEALAFWSGLGNPADEASTLLQLGNLYGAWGKLNEAADFYRKAAEAFANAGDLRSEGSAQNNLADTLIKLRSFPEARVAIHRAIACMEPYGLQAELWKAYMVLHNLERAEGNLAAAAAARAKAIDLFRQWRRGGAENHSGAAQGCMMVLAGIAQGETAQLEAAFKQALSQQQNAFLAALLAILQGSRDRSLLLDEALGYQQVVELEILLDRLG